MTDLFLNVLNLSFSATFLALAVVLARLLLKKAPRRMICLLWALVALRLIFGGIEAPFSLLPSTELIPPESLYEQSPELHTGISSIDNAINPAYSESLRPSPGASVNPLQVWLAVFAKAWLLGMAAMALWALLSCLRIRRQVRESIPLKNGVYLCDRIDSPFLFGLFRPRIYLPSNLDESLRPHVLAHERSHIRRRDHLWKPLGFALLAIHWFNPVLWLCYILLCRDIELACDERVAQTLSIPERRAYSAALLECSLKRRAIAACPLAFGEVGVKQRVKSILSYKKPAFWIILVTMALSIALAAGLLTDPAESEDTPDQYLSQAMEQELDYLINVSTDGSSAWQSLQGTEKEALRQLLDTLPAAKFTPIEERQAPKWYFAIDFMESDGMTAAFNLRLSPDGKWTLHYWDMEQGNTYLQFTHSALSAWAEPYIPQDSNDATLFGSQYFIYHFVEYDDITMTIGVPDNWRSAELPQNALGDSFALRCNPYGRDGWMEIRYYSGDETRYFFHHGRQDEPFTLSCGVTGTLYHSGDPTRWELITLDTTRGHLHIIAPGTTFSPNDWTEADYQTALTILETLSLTEGDTSLLREPNPLGITLCLENITSSGATLVCTQEGTLWDQIITGSDWGLERLVDGEWVSLMPESTVWTTIAFSINLDDETRWPINWSQLVGSLTPGTYRISKHFTGQRNPPFTLGIDGETTSETCYAEFTIE